MSLPRGLFRRTVSINFIRIISVICSNSIAHRRLASTPCIVWFNYSFNFFSAIALTTISTDILMQHLIPWDYSVNPRFQSNSLLKSFICWGTITIEYGYINANQVMYLEFGPLLLKMFHCLLMNNIVNLFPPILQYICNHFKIPIIIKFSYTRICI